MQIVAKAKDMEHYLHTAVEVDEDKPVLVDKYIKGKEVEIDGICDGRDVFVPGIMELVERTGVHSGDSMSTEQKKFLIEFIIVCGYRSSFASRACLNRMETKLCHIR